MKTPLHYQISEYDCGPTSLLNAVSFLFEREDIPPELIRNIMLYSLDNYNNEGIQGKSGTSCAAMMFLVNWLNCFGKTGRLPVSGKHLSGAEVCAGQDSAIQNALRQGGVAVVLCWFDVPHYILLTGLRPGLLLAFDPYYRKEPFPFAPDILLTEEHPCHYNRLIPTRYLNCEDDKIYALGPMARREAVLLFNEKTKLTAANTIEYFI